MFSINELVIFEKTFDQIGFWSGNSMNGHSVCHESFGWARISKYNPASNYTISLFLSFNYLDFEL